MICTSLPTKNDSKSYLLDEYFLFRNRQRIRCWFQTGSVFAYSGLVRPALELPQRDHIAVAFFRFHLHFPELRRKRFLRDLAHTDPREDGDTE